jgi:hypothetical protein
MKTLLLPLYPGKIKNDKPAVTIADTEQLAAPHWEKFALSGKTKSEWFKADAIENLETKEAIIRAGFVMLIPVLSAIDRNLGTHTMFFFCAISILPGSNGSKPPVSKIKFTNTFNH